MPPTVTAAGLNEQLGVGAAPVMVHERLTLPEYPLIGLTVIVDVDVLPEVTKAGFNGVAVSPYW